MNKIALVWPAAALALLSFIVMMIMARRRFAAVKSGALPAGYFRTYRGAEPPDACVQAARHYENLFELPVLFYALIAILLAIPFFDYALLLLAWAYVAARLVQAVIHLGSNNVSMRFYAFLVSSLVLMTMWGYAAVKLAVRGAPLL
ncbi:MAPEG family protein [Roseiterribacter gracilis]|uniref:MAPEG family protein n=1 Tax=Roseiterribacter gracilis TaxID=2812848 RepID=A0A8S8XF89_9PROT|nr:hypothetical protein TMPK1_28480 [Rhodospirillales bacterium TMPK1]